MRVGVTVKRQLRSCIEHNLDRGCPPEQLVEGLIAQRFDPPLARGLIRTFVDARAAGAPLTTYTVTVG